MPLTKCPTVRSGGTTRLRSALMPILITSRASMENPQPSSTAVPAALMTIRRRQRNWREIGRALFTLTAKGERPSFYFNVLIVINSLAGGKSGEIVGSHEAHTQVHQILLCVFWHSDADRIASGSSANAATHYLLPAAIWHTRISGVRVTDHPALFHRACSAGVGFDRAAPSHLGR